MEVIVEEEVRKVSSTMTARLIRTSVGPFAGNGLNEAFGLAVGLRAIGFGKEMSDAELATSSGKVMRAVGSATVSKHALDGNAMSLVELDGLMEGGHHAFDLLIRQQAGESQAGMIIDGDVQAFNSSAAIAQGAVTGGTDTRALKTAQLLDVQVKQFTGMGTFIALHGRFGRLQSGESMQAVAAQNARDGCLGDLKHGEDLRVGAALATKSQDVGFEFGAGPAGLADRDRGAVRELRGKAAFSGSQKPAANGSLTHMISSGDSSEGKVLKEKVRNHFCSHSGGQSGISVHVVRGVWRWVWFSSTTSLHAGHSADNLLKHDT
jgi:hypothetical protein